MSKAAYRLINVKALIMSTVELYGPYCRRQAVVHVSLFGVFIVCEPTAECHSCLTTENFCVGSEVFKEARSQGSDYDLIRMKASV